MKAIATGILVGVLALFAVVQSNSNANAACPGTGCGNGFCQLNGVPGSVTTAQDRTFSMPGEGDAWMEWCVATDPALGALEIDVNNTDMDCFDGDPDGSITPTPLFWNPSDCEGTFDVSVTGELSGDCDSATVRVRAFVWSPLEFDEETFTVLEF